MGVKPGGFFETGQPTSPRLAIPGGNFYADLFDDPYAAGIIAHTVSELFGFAILQSVCWSNAINVAARSALPAISTDSPWHIFTAVQRLATVYRADF